MTIIQEGLHSLTGGDAEETRKIVTNAINDADSNEVKGLLIHVLGDSYAHTRMDGSGLLYSSREGHLLDGTAPDEIHREGREELYLDFVDNLYQVLETQRPRASVTQTQDALGAAIQRAKDNAMFESPSLGNFTLNNIETGLVDGGHVQSSFKIDHGVASSNTISEFRTLTEDKSVDVFNLRSPNVTDVPEENNLNHVFEIKNLSNDLNGLLQVNEANEGVYSQTDFNIMKTTLAGDAAEAIITLKKAIQKDKAKKIKERITPIGKTKLDSVIKKESKINASKDKDSNDNE